VKHGGRLTGPTPRALRIVLTVGASARNLAATRDAERGRAAGAYGPFAWASRRNGGMRRLDGAWFQKSGATGSGKAAPAICKRILYPMMRR
jgi:hypothetical protein